MKKLCLIIISLLFILLNHNELVAKEPCLWMAEVNFCLGMTMEDVNNQLPKRYELISLSKNSSHLIIVEKGNKEVDVIGSVGFENDKLSSATKEWGKFSSKESMNLGNALLSLIHNINESGDNVATISIESKVREPEIKMDDITINFGKKIISVSIRESSKYGNAVSISEYIK